MSARVNKHPQYRDYIEILISHLNDNLSNVRAQCFLTIMKIFYVWV